MVNVYPIGESVDIRANIFGMPQCKVVELLRYKPPQNEYDQYDDQRCYYLTGRRTIHVAPNAYTTIRNITIRGILIEEIVYATFMSSDGQ